MAFIIADNLKVRSRSMNVEGSVPSGLESEKYSSRQQWAAVCLIKNLLVFWPVCVYCVVRGSGECDCLCVLCVTRSVDCPVDTRLCL